MLTIIVPVFNEADTVEEILCRVLAAPYDKQVIVVDDGSTDGTTALLEKWRGHPEVELLRHSRNRGKGAAIRTALEQARGRFVIIQDADLEYDPLDYPRLIEPLVRGEAQVVYGSRYLRPPHPSPPPQRGEGRERGPPPQRGEGKARVRGGRLFRLGVSVLNLCVRALYGVRLSDEGTCYKAFPTSLLRGLNLQCERFEFCPEVTAKICLLGCKILEVPIHYEPRGVQAGKKIRWRDGWQALVTLWKWRHWKLAMEGPRPSHRSLPSAKLRDLRGSASTPRRVQRNAERTTGDSLCPRKPISPSTRHENGGSKDRGAGKALPLPFFSLRIHLGYLAEGAG